MKIERKEGNQSKDKSGGGGVSKGFEVIVIEERKGNGKLRQCNAYGAVWIPQHESSYPAINEGEHWVRKNSRAAPSLYATPYLYPIPSRWVRIFCSQAHLLSHPVPPFLFSVLSFLLLYEAVLQHSIQYNKSKNGLMSKYYKFYKLICYLCPLSLFIRSFIMLLKFINHINYHTVKISIDSYFNIFSSLMT